MNERDLLRAYGVKTADLPFLKPKEYLFGTLEDRNEQRFLLEKADFDLRLEARGWARCLIGECLTTIPLSENRFICRFHERRLREGLTKSDAGG